VSNKKLIPTFEVPNLDEFHFGNVKWTFSNQHHLFHVNKLEEARHMLSFPIPPHRKTVYDLLFLTKGESVRFKGLNKYHFKENQFFFLPALQDPQAEGFFLHFSPAIFADNVHLLRPFSFLNFNTEPIVTIPEDQLAPILNIFERLLMLYEKKRINDYKLVAWYLLALFEEVNRFVDVQKNETKNSAAAITQQFKDALTQQIYTNRTVHAYAKMLHVTPNHLNKCVKKTLNKTAQTLLNEMIILEAKSLLKYSNLTISEIAYQLCESTPSNFSRFFKKQTGITPSDYLNQ